MKVPLPRNVRLVSDANAAVTAIRSTGVNGAIFPSHLRCHHALPDVLRHFLEKHHISIACDGCTRDSLERTVRSELLNCGFPVDCDDVLRQLIAELSIIANAVCLAGGGNSVCVRLSSDWYRGATWHIDNNRIVATQTYFGATTEFASSDDVIDAHKQTEIRIASGAKIFQVGERMVLLSRGDWVRETNPASEIPFLDRGLVHRRPLSEWGKPAGRRVVALIFQDIS